MFAGYGYGVWSPSKMQTLYIILTQAGKPIFYSSGDEEEIARYTAVIQAIVSCFDEQKPLQCIESDTSTIVLSSMRPLILAGIDKQRRGLHQLTAHLMLLQAQILSVLTKQQLIKQFNLRPNIDLRLILGGTEVFLNAIVLDLLASEPWTWLGALESLALSSKVRAKLNAALLAARANSSLLYGLAVSGGMFAGVVRPKQHSLHPPDLHLLFSMVFNTTVFKEGEHWVPICFPKFNPNGFLYAYIRQIAPPSTFLVLVSPNKNGFFEMQRVGNAVLTELERTLVDTISSTSSLHARVKCVDIRVAPVAYFVYKQRGLVQFTQSAAEAGVKQKLADIKLKFAQLQASMTQKRQRIAWSKYGAGQSLLGWHTPAFELYCFAETEDKEAVSTAVKRLVSWLRKHETRLFVVDGASF